MSNISCNCVAKTTRLVVRVPDVLCLRDNMSLSWKDFAGQCKFLSGNYSWAWVKRDHNSSTTTNDWCSQEKLFKAKQLMHLSSSMHSGSMRGILGLSGIQNVLSLRKNNWTQYARSIICLSQGYPSQGYANKNHLEANNFAIHVLQPQPQASPNSTACWTKTDHWSTKTQENAGWLAWILKHQLHSPSVVTEILDKFWKLLQRIVPECLVMLVLFK